jgi:hypothetical protein
LAKDRPPEASPPFSPNAGKGVGGFGPAKPATFGNKKGPQLGGRDRFSDSVAEVVVVSCVPARLHYADTGSSLSKLCSPRLIFRLLAELSNSLFRCVFFISIIFSFVCPS